MSKKKKLTEPEIHVMIISDAKIRLGCKDVEPDFTLYHIGLTSYPRSNWDVLNARNPLVEA